MKKFHVGQRVRILSGLQYRPEGIPSNDIRQLIDPKTVVTICDIVHSSFIRVTFPGIRRDNGNFWAVHIEFVVPVIMKSSKRRLGCR